MDAELAQKLGPLAALAGTWEGDAGLDVSWSYSKSGTKETAYRERASFDPFGPVDNGTQILYGLDYRMQAWPLGEADPFHMEVGYWLWDARAGQVMRCFMVPRGITVLAVGSAAPDARGFSMSAEAGSETAGVLSNPTVAATARTVRYEVSISLGEDGSFSYNEDTVLEMKVQPGDLYHHTDRNTLRKV